MRIRIFTLLCLLAVPSFVFAVGGGGGGSSGGGGGVSTCDQDEWDCGDWGECSLEGTRERTCELTFDCTHVTDSEPVTAESCTPECTEDTWSCSGWSPCFANGTQSRSCTKTDDCSLTDTDSPITSQTCEPNCTDDVWECGDWSSCSATGNQTRDCELTFDCEFDDAASPDESQSCTPECTSDTWECSDWESCDTDGNQSRDCELTNDCSGVVSSKPTSSQRCSYQQCEEGELIDRIECRLNLSQAGREREIEIRYFPEVCRPFEGDVQEECIKYYAKYQPCWDIEGAEDRVECARKVLWLPENIPAAKTACADDEACLDELEEHVHHLILFRFYDLEQRAEAFIDEGVDVKTTAAFVQKVIENKIAFLGATTYEQRKALIEKMRADWKAHMDYVRPILNR